MVVPSSSDHVGSWKTDLGRFQISHTTDRGETLVLRYFPPLAIDSKDIVSTTGAGDSLVGSLMAEVANDTEVIHNPNQLSEVMMRAQEAAILSLKTSAAVSPLLSASS